MERCDSCGKLLHGTWEYCPICGTRIPWNDLLKVKRNPVMGIVGFITAVFGAALGILAILIEFHGAPFVVALVFECLFSLSGLALGVIGYTLSRKTTPAATLALLALIIGGASLVLIPLGLVL